jgi:hypothetical protein
VRTLWCTPRQNARLSCKLWRMGTCPQGVCNWLQRLMEWLVSDCLMSGAKKQCWQLSLLLKGSGVRDLEVSHHRCLFQLSSGGVNAESVDVPLPNPSIKRGGTARGRVLRDLLFAGLSTWDTSLEIQHQPGIARWGQFYLSNLKLGFEPVIIKCQPVIIKCQLSQRRCLCVYR